MNWNAPTNWTEVDRDTFHNLMSSIEYVREGYADAIVYKLKTEFKQVGAKTWRPIGQMKYFVNPEFWQQDQ